MLDEAPGCLQSTTIDKNLIEIETQKHRAASYHFDPGIWERAMAAFSVPGTGQNACAELKAHLDANDSAFEAKLSALFGAPAKLTKPGQAKVAAESWGSVTSQRESRSSATRFSKR
jgi:hypothetical protein